MTDLNKERSEFEAYEHSKKPCAVKEKLFEVFTKDGLDEDEYLYIGKYVDSFMQEKWELWQKAKAQAVPEGYVLMPKVPSEKMFQAYERYSVAPMSTLSKTGYKAMVEASESGAEG